MQLRGVRSRRACGMQNSLTLGGDGAAAEESARFSRGSFRIHGAPPAAAPPPSVRVHCAMADCGAACAAVAAASGAAAAMRFL